MTGSSTPIFVGSGMGSTPIFVEEGDVQLIIGTTRRGRSRILEAQAERLGISYDEMLKRMEPTQEEKEVARMRQEQRREKEAARLNAVREAYWAGIDADDSLLGNLNDALTIACIAENPTQAQVKELFMMLPGTIIGQGIAWGFGDTEVRGSIHRFVDESRDAVAQRVAKA